ncbi:Lsr2 family protein [Curtobacterium flaccumfaciens]|uniref:Lsr2 family protein n=1 Tax=Curtobacterium flaccumfaciens TaxID=2035 RepID=UPI00387A05F8
MPHRRLALPGDRDHVAAELFRIRLHHGAHPSSRSQRPYLSGVNRTCSSPIDLTDDNADALREAFSDYVAAARKVSGRSGRATGGSSPKRGNSNELARIREWANANGHEVSSRGRISQAVRDAYDAAH